jgi:crotonobetainyl-CoA:carnitine CoA-transferase CaiB-like acyl-CoA transferase
MESRAHSLVPEQFGPLQGVRIISSGTLIAEPFAAALAAQMGAEVIQIERPGEGDIFRSIGRKITRENGASVNSAWVQERRNTFNITLDMATLDGKDLFLRLVSQADLWMESSKAGTYKGWGLDDETILRANPSIVITHVSGFGQDGQSEYLGRASYDMIGQAFGGTMYLTGSPDPEPPMRSVPLTADYMTAYCCLWSSLAAYISAQRTGQGQVIDLSQFEAVHQTLGGNMVEWFEEGTLRERSGNRPGVLQPSDAYSAKDGLVVIMAVGTVYGRVCRVLGLDPAEEKWRQAETELESPAGIEFDAILRGWVEERTVQEVVEVMNAAQVACSPIMSAKDMAEDPHYQARNVHIEWEDEQLGRKVKGVGVTPKFSRTPGQIWRG